PLGFEPLYPIILARTLALAVSTTILCALTALPLAFFCASVAGRSRSTALVQSPGPNVCLANPPRRKWSNRSDRCQIGNSRAGHRTLSGHHCRPALFDVRLPSVRGLTALRLRRE